VRLMNLAPGDSVVAIARNAESLAEAEADEAEEASEAEEAEGTEADVPEGEAGPEQGS